MKHAAIAADASSRPFEIRQSELNLPHTKRVRQQKKADSRTARREYDRCASTCQPFQTEEHHENAHTMSDEFLTDSLLLAWRQFFCQLSPKEFARAPDFD